MSFSELAVRADVPGISDEEFQEAVSQAAEGCPISQALKGNEKSKSRPPPSSV